MSYHSKKSFAQRFSGLIFVVGLHLAAVVAMYFGLMPKKEMELPKDVKVDIKEDKKVEEVAPPPPPPDNYVPPPPPPVNVDFSVAPDVVAAPTAISPPPAAAPAAPVAVAAPPSSAKIPKNFTGPRADKYPKDAMRLNQEGSAGLQLYITEDGKVSDVKLATSSGVPILDEYAVSEAKLWKKFTPCMEGDKPKACWFNLKVTMKVPK